MRLWPSLCCLAIALCNVEAAAIQIHLAQPFTFRKTTYQHFDTEDMSLSPLQKMRQQLADIDPENAARIESAIAKGLFRHLSNQLYLYPPVPLGSKMYYQISIYTAEKADSKAAKFLKRMLDQLRVQDAIHYARPIERIQGRLNMLGERAVAAQPAKRERIEESDDEVEVTSARRVRTVLDDEDEDSSWGPQRANANIPQAQEPAQVTIPRPVMPEAFAEEPMPWIFEDFQPFTREELEMAGVFLPDVFF
jgi:hypothetical protein